jgi:hypothetical protein
MQKPTSICLQMLFVCTLMLLSSCSTFNAFRQKRLLKKMSAYLEGDFSNEQQHHKRPKDFYNLRVHISPIWDDKPTEKWFYVEQAHFVKERESVYRQRIYRLSMDTAKYDHFHCDIYRIDSTTASGVQYHNPASLKAITKENIVGVEGCSLLFQWNKSKKRFMGQSGRNCLHTYNGASYIHSNIKLYKNEMQSKDSGLNKRKQRIWGPKGDYIFVKKQD